MSDNFSNRGIFIAFEGGEGAGKSTQIRLLAKNIAKYVWGNDDIQDIDEQENSLLVVTREPGGTACGKQIRELLLHVKNVSIDPRTEAMLMAADRLQHVQEVILPALSQGKHVLTDRYFASSIAYQGFGRGIDVEDLMTLTNWATQGLVPDLTIFLDVDPHFAQQRLQRSLDRFEEEKNDFHMRVHEGFLWFAEQDETWVTFDGKKTQEDLAALIFGEVVHRFDNRLKVQTT